MRLRDLTPGTRLGRWSAVAAVVLALALVAGWILAAVLVLGS